ncbi:hypothetical protein G6514_010302 [Epicoccum nigrum]|nr:hypothetical protein G6514_010302 [Epicoccum nigrum]
MADKPKLTPATPQSITTSPPAPQIPHSTSPPSDSEDTEYQPTPLHSPGGPQYEDLPPSYDFALSDAQNGVASLDASQIEAHRVSANEGPDDPEVWEYRMRGEAADGEEEAVHEEAPAYEGHVPVQHVAHSENIAVGRVQGSAASTSTAGGASAPAYEEDPPHSVPQGAGSESQRGQPWGPFGAGQGPFGAPGNGPFGALGNGPFGAPGSRPFGAGAPGHAPFGHGQRGRHAPARRCRGGRSSSSQDWAAFGQNMGRWGEEFGRRMGNWGEQVGRQAGAMGEQIGRQAGAMGQQVGRQAAGMGQQLGRDTSAWAAAYSGGATASAQTTSNTATASSSVQVRDSPPRYSDPPTYSSPAGAGVAGQETGVLHSNDDLKAPSYPVEKAPAYPSEEKVPQSPPENPSARSLDLSKQKASDDFVDDDSSSISSDSTDSSFSSSSSDDDGGDAAQATFLARIASIDRAAESAASKGKKSPEEIAHERGLAIAKATREKEVAEQREASRAARREQKRELRSRKRELAREYRTKKKEVRERADGKGKGKGKAKKGTEWKELKREYKAKRRALKRERVDAKRAWKRERREEKRGISLGAAVEQKVLNEKA